MDSTTNGVHVTTDAPEEPGTGGVVNRNGAVDSRHRTKAAAIATGPLLAKRHGAQFTIHRKDGAVIETRTYAKTPL